MNHMGNKLDRVLHYLKIWVVLTKNSFLVMLAHRSVFAIFVVAKLLRLVLFVTFIFFAVRGSGDLAGYGVQQVLFFFLTFTLIDTIVQFLFRNVYMFRGQVVSGDFDLTLVKPVKPLFQALLGGADIMDLFTLPIIGYALYYVGHALPTTPGQIALYAVLVINSLVIATAFHIFVLGFGIVSLEVDHTIMIYRDITSLGRLPVDIYKEPLKGAITYLIPIGVMMTIPAKAFIGLISPAGVALSFALAAVFIVLAMRFWRFALTKYASASS